MAAKNATQKLLDLVGKFVTEQNGAWGHGDWEKILEDAGDLGFQIDFNAQRHLGEILEGAKHFHHHAPAPKPKKAKANAKPKAASKAKAKPKSKAKTKVKSKAKSDK